jgi:hypothetical protein
MTIRAGVFYTRPGYLFITSLMLCCSALHAETVLLQANGPDSTYELIESKGYGLEVPDCKHKVRHIAEKFDTELGKNVFVFSLHRDLDDDRCTNSDRQRCELRGNIGKGLLGVRGSTTIYRWKFKLDAGFRESGSFCHIFQIKAYGNGHGSDAPLLTLTPRAGNMEIGRPGVVKSARLSDFLGVWVSAYVKTKHDNNGSCEVVVRRVSDNTPLISWSTGSTDIWEDGALYGCPKFGIYRSLDNKSSLRDENVLFADIAVSVGEETTDAGPRQVETVRQKPDSPWWHAQVLWSGGLPLQPAFDMRGRTIGEQPYSHALGILIVRSGKL